MRRLQRARLRRAEQSVQRSTFVCRRYAGYKSTPFKRFMRMRALTQMPVPAGGGGGGGGSGELANDGHEIERQDFLLNFFRSRVSVFNSSSLPLWLLFAAFSRGGVGVDSGPESWSRLDSTLARSCDSVRGDHKR